MDFSYVQIIRLMQSTNPTVQLIATNALASFVYNNPRVQLYLGHQYQFSFDYFQKFLQSPNEQTRCAAAFQVDSDRRRESLSTPVLRWWFWLDSFVSGRSR